MGMHMRHTGPSIRGLVIDKIIVKKSHTRQKSNPQWICLFNDWLRISVAAHDEIGAYAAAVRWIIERGAIIGERKN